MDGRGDERTDDPMPVARGTSEYYQSKVHNYKSQEMDFAKILN